METFALVLLFMIVVYGFAQQKLYNSELKWKDELTMQRIAEAERKAELQEQEPSELDEFLKQLNK